MTIWDTQEFRSLDTGGYGIVWNDDMDIACDELYFNGDTIPTPFDDLITFSDAGTRFE